jgi:acetyl esterase/lipase
MRDGTTDLRRRAVVGGLAALALAGCSPVDALNVLVPDGGYVRHAGIAYGPAPRQALDVYEPAAPASATQRPVVVFFYGGSWRGGSRETYRFVGEALTSRGYVAVLPDYRVHPEAVYPTFVEDGAAALGWVRANIARHGGDPERIVVMGHSAGAHIAALLALDQTFLEAAHLPADTIKGLVGLAGPYSFDPLEWRVTRAVFGHLQEPSIVRPVRYARSDAPPMLLLHGDADTTVGPYNSADMAAALRGVNAPVTHIVYKDTAHVGIVLALAAPFRGRAPTLADTARFIDGLFPEARPAS